MHRLTHINLAKDFRGGERQTLLLCEELAGEYQQRLVCRADTMLFRKASSHLEIEVIDVANSPVSALLATGHCDLIHVHDGRSVQVGAARSMLSGTPFVITRRLARAPSDRLLTRWAYGRGAAFVGVSRAVADAMRAWMPDKAVEVIHDGLDELRADEEKSRALRASSDARLVVGHVGALDDQTKGQLSIIGAARTLAETHPQVEFWLIGEGPDDAFFREAAHGLPNVRFIGWVENIADYYAAMDMFVFPSRFEALGSSILEAMSFGLPVIASDAGGIPDIVSDGTSGLLIAAGDDIRLTQALRRLVDDESLRTRLGAGARARADEFSAARMAQRYRGLYRHVLSAGTRAAA